jgi:hypothetical protein
MVPKGKPRVDPKVSGIKLWMLFESTIGIGTITLNPTFVSFTLLEPVSH